MIESMPVHAMHETEKFETLSKLINPILSDEFLSQYWEKKPLIINRSDPKYFNELFGLRSVDEVLDTSRPRGNSIRIVKEQVELSKNKYENQDGSLNLNQIYAAYADGYTVVINEIERFWTPIKKLCRQLTNESNHHFVANMYLTPKGQKALKPHYDTHDVYVVQIHGQKTWNLYDANYKTPLLQSFQPIFKSEQLNIKHEVSVSAGDLMYMPRGIPHDAYTTDECSIHLTLGAYPHQWLDLISASFKAQAFQNISLRKAVPFGFLGVENIRTEKIDEIKKQMKSIAYEFIENINVNTAYEVLLDEIRTKQQPCPSGHFASLERLEHLDLNTILKTRKGISAYVQNAGPHARIIFPGNVVKGPKIITPSLEFIAKQEHFKIAHIPDIPDRHKLTLCKRLIRGGLLEYLEG